MWSFLNQPGLAIMGVDFTDGLSFLLVALEGVVWLSAGIILWTTIHHYLSQPTGPVKRTAFTVEEPRNAA
ncbi:MAG TPA: hypothetical protein VKK81_09325 [Candidatus Binatia bacterium]|nr:hypothetical protein [Candidatus Binatia bacterium]